VTTKRQDTLLLIATLLLWLVGFLISIARRESVPETPPTWIHMPKSGRCPDGFKLVPDLFVRAEKFYAGCEAEGTLLQTHGKADHLAPGEGVHARLTLKEDH
jgi:hypothetical protein